MPDDEEIDVATELVDGPSEPSADDEPADEPGGAPWLNWLYTGPDRIYTNIPVTATTGTIITWHSNPGLGDGCWTATTQAANTLPDNHREDPAPAVDTPEEG